MKNQTVIENENYSVNNHQQQDVLVGTEGFFVYEKPFNIESGATFTNLHLAYTTYGQLNAAGDNVIWIFQALTANSKPHEWWPEMLGDGKVFDPAKDFIICVNMPGSCYGSISPLDENPATGHPYYHSFPFFTTRDMIRAYMLLRKELGIHKIKIGIGGSMGGQQLLEWAIEEPELFEVIIPMATNAVHSAWGKAFNASQRFAIEADGTWQEQHADAGKKEWKWQEALAFYRTVMLRLTIKHSLKPQMKSWKILKAKATNATREPNFQQGSTRLAIMC